MRAVLTLSLALALASCSFDGSNPFLGFGDDTDGGSFVGSPDASLDPDAEVDPLDPDAEPELQPDAAPAAQLNSDDVVVRYFADDAPSGSDAEEMADAVDPGLDLSINYDETASFTTVDGHVGLEFTATAGNAGASTSVQDTKLRNVLNQSTSATIELVFDMPDPNNFSRLFHIGQGTNRGRFSLQARDNGNLRYSMNDDEKVRWNVDVRQLGRIVVHLVIDTTEAVDVDRSKLYINGTLITVDQTSNLNQNDVIDIPDQEDILFFLGNRPAGDRGWVGVLYYAALYSAPLSEAVVTNNAAALLVNDDENTLGN